VTVTIQLLKLKALPLYFPAWLTELYNDAYSMNKLLAALHTCRNISLGPGGFNNEKLIDLPPIGREFLLAIYKSKAVPLHTMEALGGRGGIAPTHSRPRH
jgi:hypothetical protein